MDPILSPIVSNNVGVDLTTQSSVPPPIVKLSSPIVSNIIGMDPTTWRPVPPPEIRSSNIVPENNIRVDPTTQRPVPPPEIRLSNIVPEMVTSNNEETIQSIYIEEESNLMVGNTTVNSMLLLVRELYKQQSCTKKLSKEHQLIIMNALEKISQNPTADSKLTTSKIWNKSLIAQKKTNLTDIPKAKDISKKLISKWREGIMFILECVPWNLEGKLVANMEIIDNPKQWTKPYEVCVTHLALLLTKLLRDAEHESLHDEMGDSVQMSHGVLRLHEIHNWLILLHPTAVCNVIDQLAISKQDNKETSAGYRYRIAEQFKRLKQLGYKSFSDLEMAFTQ